MPDRNEQLVYDMGFITCTCVLSSLVGKLILGLLL